MLAALWAILYESPLAAGVDPAMSFTIKLSYMLGISCKRCSRSCATRLGATNCTACGATSP